MEDQNNAFLQLLADERARLKRHSDALEALDEAELAALVVLAANTLDDEIPGVGEAIQQLSSRQQVINREKSSLVTEAMTKSIHAAEADIDSLFCDLNSRLVQLKEQDAILREDFQRLRHQVMSIRATQGHRAEIQTLTEQAALEREHMAELASDLIVKAAAKLDHAPAVQTMHKASGQTESSMEMQVRPTSPTLSETVEDFARAKRVQKKWTAKTEEENRAVYDLFIRIVGNKPIADVDDEIIVGYLETLQKLPPNLNKSPNYVGKTIEEVIALSPVPMKPRTVNKNIERVSSLFKWAMGKKKYALTNNPAAGMSVDESGAAKRQPFTVPELVALLSSEEFTTRQFQNSYAFWLIPMGLLTGARLGELCQLYLSDFVEHNGVPCIEVSDEEEGQRLKNVNAKRLVPIHSKLIELGLLRYVDELRKAGEIRLFPELNERRDGFAQAASNWFQRHKKRCGIEGKHTKVFHSFRHTFISALLDDEVPEHAVAQIVGHEANLITGKVYWNTKDAAKRKPTVEKFQPHEDVWRLIPQFEQVRISGRREPRRNKQ